MSMEQLQQAVITTAGAEETDAFAAAVGQLTESGDVILLNGGIGSGKTVFAKAIARAIGVQQVVTSPSFVVHAAYDDGRLPFNHFDLYRLDARYEADELLIGEYADGAVTVIEWADRFDVVDPPYLRIEFELGDGDDDRRLTLTYAGAEWERRWLRLQQLVSAAR
ncbi:tRNA (adenosine(37)-N6)-threonylcarbamoyltransferase complex ATPase subunit type 1 TsaE [Solirubrobacter ginsenosidimutans]|uniref:tRNA threonylcarbamoyladenosine biosynthesis protein TsaE n=1 Tax=Solirubrobacter ginsenosidimutans TaxID=490573 RepID=A0A9X3S3F2_9ACTN|nr:tRNA (adenosine(37)-N6)-threonylcarbamoyltransferase complex ATPase subunit type 1 TsaE [Solirubrobacter ginsenosidimutans]MDA0164564.1 tRNA (adenosine(37)-N6)-threonylcarbamoyltransferase complex ATPase subunit type 1 TsaE [Solirubrobacter ginsenosidimutans]